MVIAYFISPHGFGHAARAAAVMNALARQQPATRFEIFTRVPRWFFANSLDRAFTYHHALTDIGLVQTDSLREDLPQTLRCLRAFLPLSRARVARLARRVRQLGCWLVVCDIAPLGIAVARAANVPSLLIENFTWDWIYAGYADRRFARHIAYLRDVFRSADYHIQTEPVCARTRADLVTPPVSRAPRTPAREIRAQLGVPSRARLVLVTMGGGAARAAQPAFLDQLTRVRHVHFVIPGNRRAQTRDNLILLSHRSAFYHPDLMNACDAVIGKAGYSTVAEAYRAGIPFGYVPRETFRESPVMERFIRREMRSVEISAAEFERGEWLTRLPDLLALPRRRPHAPNGAAEIAHFVTNLLR